MTESNGDTHWSLPFAGFHGALSSQNFFHHLAVHVGQAVIAPLKAEREPGVVESELVEERGMKVVDVDEAGGDVEAELVGDAVGVAPFDAAAGEPEAEAAAVVIAPVIVLQASLAIDGAAKFACADDERVFQKATLHQIFEQAGDRPVDFGSLGDAPLLHFLVMIPGIIRRDLDVPHTLLGKLSREKTLTAEVVGRFDAYAIKRVRGFRFVVQTHHGGYRGGHVHQRQQWHHGHQ